MGDEKRLVGRTPLVALAMAGVALLLPSLIWGTLPSQSSPTNLAWAAQFAGQVLQGILYPRWLFDSFGGLGAPTFYFQPPLAFWVDALVNGLTLDLLPTSSRLSVTAVVLFAASGVTMYVWLRVSGAAPGTDLIGALVYMAAPYHLVDHYLRGALPEMAAYTIVPLVMLGVNAVRRRQWAGELLLAISYAALLMAHPPTALLVSLTALPIFVLFVAWDDRFFLVRCALALALGLGLAAPYLWPLISLQDAILDWLNGPYFYRPVLLTPDRWPEPALFTVITASAAGWLLASLSVLGRRGQALLWALVSLTALLLLPWLWSVPLLSRVQFPGRLLMVVEFAAITAVCLAPWPQDRPRLVLLALAFAALAGATAVTVAGVANKVAQAMHPAATGLEPQPARQPLIACSPTPRICHAEPGPFGLLRIELEGEQPTTVTLRRLAFPAWQLTPSLPISASGPDRLVSFVAPPGRHELVLERQILPAERWGWIACALSLLALALLVVGTGLARR